MRRGLGFFFSVINVVTLSRCHLFLKVGDACFDEDVVPLDEFFDVAVLYTVLIPFGTLDSLPFSKSRIEASTFIKGTSSVSVNMAMSAKEVMRSEPKAGMRLWVSSNASTIRLLLARDTNL